VLIRAIEDGVSSLTWEQDAFAYAEALDDASGRYLGLRAGEHAPVLIDGSSLVVRSEVARRQFGAEHEGRGGSGEGAAGGTESAELTGAGAGGTAGGTATGGEGRETAVRRFFGVKTLDPQRVSRDADQVATEIVRHLTALVDANVEVRLEISAEVPSGIPDEVVRTVTENANTLKLDQHGFSES
jgi:hypothetical protein